MTFTPGLELSRRLHEQVVGPALSRIGVPYTAALIGPGSEVLGFDTERSTDHDWGPRLQVFLHTERTGSDPDRVRGRIEAALPDRFGGYPTRFPRTGDENTRSRVDVVDLHGWVCGFLGGVDPWAPLRTADWLALPTQRLAEFTAGAVFHDALGLGAARDRLQWYPDDVWRYVLACQWGRIAQEAPFPGRCAEAGDEVGSAVVTARLVRDLIRLNLLIARRYPPYSKWLGSAFARVPDAGVLQADLRAALAAPTWPEREDRLVAAMEATARRQNAANLAEPQPETVRYFHDRPFRVIAADEFAAALREGIADPALRSAPLIGAVDTFVDSTDALGSLELLQAAVRAAFPEL